MSFFLGQRSMTNLAGVHPKLINVVTHALAMTKQDFGVAGKAVRTAEEQHALFLKGASQKDGYTSRSNHQPWADGFGHAVDLTPFINGQFDVNNEAAQYEIAAAMSQASEALAIAISWGGAWGKEFVGTTVADMQGLVAAYRRDHPGPDFIDLPHFQLA